jgi:hypothetical protein
MSITTAGSITLEIQQQPFTLEGLIGSSINVQYHKTPEDGYELDTVMELAGQIAKLFGVGEGFSTKLNELLVALKGVGGLDKIVETLMNSKIIITDLGINTAEPATYQFGFYVRLQNAQLGPVTIAGFGVVFTYEAKSGEGDVKTLPAV